MPIIVKVQSIALILSCMTIALFCLSKAVVEKNILAGIFFVMLGCAGTVLVVTTWVCWVNSCLL